MKQSVFRSRISLVWLSLVAATGMSLEVGHGPLFQDIRYANAVVIVIAFIKVRLVVLDFMNLRTAPQFMRVLAEMWLIGMCALLSVMVVM